MTTEIDRYSPRTGRLYREDDSIFNVADYYADSKAPFGELSVIERRILIELKSTYGISTLRDVVTVVGTGTVTNANGEYAVATETGLESDVAADGITGGQVLWSGLVSATGGGANAKGFGQGNELNLDLPELQPITVCARTLAATATISSVLRMREEW